MAARRVLVFDNELDLLVFLSFIPNFLRLVLTVLLTSDSDQIHRLCTFLHVTTTHLRYVPRGTAS